MLRHQFVLFAALLSAVSTSHARDVILPKSLIVELIEYHCSSPDPNPKTNPVLEYDCSDAYEDADGDEQSMDYSLRLIPLIAQDFNKDGITDIAVEVESSGPLGGSVTTNSALHYLLLDKNKTIINDHQILLYAPFSDNIVEYNVNKSRILYSAIPNFRSNPDSYDNGELIDPPLKFEVNWVNGSPISTYYRDNCRLATIKDKSLLKLEGNVTRFVDIDIHDYTQIITEETTIGNLKISANMQGCNRSTAVYDIIPLPNKPLPVLAEVLTTLIPIAHHDQQLKTLLALDKRSQIKFGERFALDSKWQAIVNVDRSNISPTMSIIFEQSE